MRTLTTAVVMDHDDNPTEEVIEDVHATTWAMIPLPGARFCKSVTSKVLLYELSYDDGDVEHPGLCTLASPTTNEIQQPKKHLTYM